MTIDQIFEHMDLRLAHIALCLSGVLLSTYLMQLIWHNPEEGGMLLRWARRINLALVALAMLWSLSIADQRGWQPWPAEVLLLLSVDVMMLIRVIVVHRMRARGARVTPPYPGVAAHRRVR